MEDHKILELYEKRDEQAIAETKQRYGTYCQSIARSVLGNDADAEEAVSDAFLQAWLSIPPNKPNSFKLYMGKLTRNASITKWRSNTAEKRGGGQITVALEELGDCVVGDTGVSAELNKKVLGEMISDFLRREKKRDRAVFLRRYFYLEDVASIARRYGLKESNVHQILSRTRRKLKVYLLQEGYIL